MKSTIAMAAALLLAAGWRPARAQAPYTDVIAGAKVGGSANIHALSHIPIGRSFSGSDIEMEQELWRPYVYTSVMLQTGTNIISVKDPGHAYILYQWRAANAELHTGTVSRAATTTYRRCSSASRGPTPTSARTSST